MQTNEKLDELLDLVKQQQAFLEMYVRSWVDDYRSSGGAVFCGKGCRTCCSLAVHTGFAEALAVARSLDEVQERRVAAYAAKLPELVHDVTELTPYLRRHRQEIGFCPLLDDAGACSVYRLRPLTCRSLISTRESSWCGVDFAELSQADKDAFIAALDRKVVAFPSHYVAALQESGKEFEEAGAARMRKLLGFSLYGNLGVLVHLIRNHRLDEACLVGEAAVADAIAKAGFDHPLLVAIS